MWLRDSCIVRVMFFNSVRDCGHLLCKGNLDLLFRHTLQLLVFMLMLRIVHGPAATRASGVRKLLAAMHGLYWRFRAGTVRAD
jgi:hypothetical protein